jgi:hypothetical protein
MLMPHLRLVHLLSIATQRLRLHGESGRSFLFSVTETPAWYREEIPAPIHLQRLFTIQCGTALQLATGSPFYITGGNWQATVGSNMAYHIGTNGAGRVTVIIRPVLADDTLFNSKMWQRTSTDNGANWSNAVPIFVPYTVNNGEDTVATASGSGFIYKKNTDRWFLAFPVTNDNLYEHARLMFRKSNGDTTTIVTRSQVGATISYNTTMSFVFNIDNPALGFSADGTTLYCVYSVVMPDTSRGFNQRDLYMQYSLNEGTTWSAPSVNYYTEC